jgi:uncharacterized RDD family membrane protein YckC
MQWFYVENEEQAGPVDDAGFARLQSEGLIQDQTLVYCQGMADWMTLADARSQGFWTAPSAAPEPVPPAQNPLAAGMKPRQTEASGMVACPSCGTRVWENELIPLGDRYVCAHCRDVNLQKIREGVDPLGANVRYAGFGHRFLGSFVDWIIMQVYSVVLNAMFGMGILDDAGGVLETPLLITYFALAILVPLAYAVYFLGNPRFQATPGMMAAKIKLVRPDGTNMTYLRSFGRYLASFISAMIMGLGYLMMLWDSENRTLHDRMADTRVIFK